MNAYTNELDDSFRGQKVTVHANGRRYEGFARVFNYNDREVILHGATCNGEEVGTVVIHGYEDIRNENAPPVENVRIATISESVYAARQYDDADINSYVRTIRERGGVSTFPTARPIEGTDQYELVGGHKRTEASRRAGFETIPLRIVEYSEWEALRVFVDEHIPMNSQEEADGSRNNRGWYSKEEIDTALTKMLDRWDEDDLRDLPQVAFWLDYEEPDEPDEAEASDEATEDSDTDGTESVEETDNETEADDSPVQTQ